jgi:hypothetical protein
MLIALIALLAGLQPGLYRSQTMEVGAALLLNPDGHFRYQLDYGAVSEAAEGRWSAKDGIVTLNSTRMEGNWREDIFRDQPLQIDGDTLILIRYGSKIRFVHEPEDQNGE